MMAKPDATTALVSVLMPVFDAPVYNLNAAIASALGQYDERWELCICDDGSSDDGTLALLDYYRGRDPRIKIVRSPHKLQVAGATNLAATIATGRFVGFLDAHGLLVPTAVTAVAQVVEADPVVDLLHTDEDEAETDGSFGEADPTSGHPRFATDPLRFLVVRKSLFLRIGGLQEARSGACDLAQRANAVAARTVHIRESLQHRRKRPASAAANGGAYALTGEEAEVKRVPAGLRQLVDDDVARRSCRGAQL